jgi:hypothetical protein
LKHLTVDAITAATRFVGSDVVAAAGGDDIDAYVPWVQEMVVGAAFEIFRHVALFVTLCALSSNDALITIVLFVTASHC